MKSLLPDHTCQTFIQLVQGTEQVVPTAMIRYMVGSWRYGIRPVTLHPTRRADLTRHGYRASQFENAFARLLQKPTKDPNIRTLDPEAS
jgi:hypothetical protein